jgi:signal transduction protein with GAF and PtsI domain
MSSSTLKFLQQENQRLMDENRQLNEEMMAMRDYLKYGLRSLQRAAEAITAEVEPMALLDTILYSVLTVMDVANGSILLLDDETDELVFVVVHGELGQTLPGHRLPSDQGIAGWVATHRVPQVVNNVRADQRFSGAIDEIFKFQTHSLLCVPMISRGKMLGVIEAVNKFNQQDFNEIDVSLLSTLAHIAAMAIDWLGSENSETAQRGA